MNIKPMLCESIDANLLPELVFKDEYFFEQKLDGHRILLRLDHGIFTALQRQGKVSQHDQAFKTKEWSQVADSLSGRSAFLDGEYIDSVLYLFDLPFLDGEVDVDTPYAKRRYYLDRYFENMKSDVVKLVPCAKQQHRKALLAAECIRKNAEGVIVKHRDGIYLSGGRSKEVLKAKFTKTADLVVTALNFKGKDNAVLSAYNEAGKLIEVGRCSTIGKPVCKVGDVLEVKYLYLGANKRLVQSTIMCKRTDKSAKECSVQQLIPTSKDVLFDV